MTYTLRTFQASIILLLSMSVGGAVAHGNVEAAVINGVLNLWVITMFLVNAELDGEIAQIKKQLED